MTSHQILSREDWTAARLKLLDEEKAALMKSADAVRELFRILKV